MASKQAKIFVPEEAADGAPPAGLDAAQHARQQQIDGQAEGLREAVLPTCMAAGLNLGG